MSPSQLSILLRLYFSPTPTSGFPPHAYNDACYLVDRNLAELKGGNFVITHKGATHIKKVLKLELPGTNLKEDPIMATKKINLYLLETGDYSYDEYNGFVIRAENEESARLLASVRDKRDKDEPNVWLDSKISTCVLVTGEGEQEIVVSSFNAG